MPQITQRDIYDAIERLEEKMDRKLEKMDGKIDSLENFRDKALGVLTIFSAFVSLGATFIWQKIFGMEK